MRHHVLSGIVAVFVVAACGGDEAAPSGDDVLDVGADTAVADATGGADATTPDVADSRPSDAAQDAASDAAGDTSAPECDRTGLTLARSLYSGNYSHLVYGWTTRAEAPFDFLSLGFYESPENPQTLEGPGSYELGGSPQDRDFATCTTCLTIEVGCTELGCDGLYMAMSGGVDVDVVDAEASIFEATLVDVKAVEMVSNEQTGLVFPKNGGKRWCLDGVTIDHAPECSDEVACQDASVCNELRGWCVECVDDADCATAVAPACRIGAGYIAACGEHGTCDDDDAAEDNDGPTQAKPLTLGTPLDATVCLRGDPSDWWSFTLAETQNVELVLTWDDDPAEFVDALVMQLWTSAGERVDEVAQRVTFADPLSMVGHALAPGTYYVNVRNPYAAFRFGDDVGNPHSHYQLVATPSAVCASDADCGASAVCFDRVCMPAECDLDGFAPKAEVFMADFTGSHFGYGARTAFGGRFDSAVLEFRSIAGQPAPIESGPGRFLLGTDATARSYATCPTCLTLGSGCTENGCDASFIAVGGSADITTWDTNAGRVVGKVENAKLVEVLMDIRGRTTARRNGRVWCVAELPIDNDSECDSAAIDGCGAAGYCLAGDRSMTVCASTYGCVSGLSASECVACGNDDDCVGNAAGSRCSQTAFRCTECGTDLHCPAATPVCGPDLGCVAVDACERDDSHEPVDDGPAGAYQLDLGEEAFRSICSDRDASGLREFDWFLVSPATPARARLSIFWAREQLGRESGGISVSVIAADQTVRSARAAETSPIIFDVELTAGRNYIRVHGLDIPASQSLDYQLRLLAQ